MTEYKKDDLRLEILEKISTLATAAFGLVAALAWNDAIQSLFKSIFREESTLLAKFIYALIVTGLIVVVTMQFGRSINGIKERIGHHNQPSDI